MGTGFPFGKGTYLERHGAHVGGRYTHMLCYLRSDDAEKCETSHETDEMNAVEELAAKFQQSALAQTYEYVKTFNRFLGCYNVLKKFI